MIKKRIKMMLSVMVCVSLAACSGEKPDSAAVAEQVTETEKQDETEKPDETENREETESQTEAEPTAVYTDGTYTGIGTGRNGEIAVEVVIEGEEIASVQVKSHQESPWISDRALQEIPENVIKYQTLSVDSITGATLFQYGSQISYL